MDRSESGYWRARGQWVVITTSVMILAWFASNLVPFFDDFVSLTGSLCAGPLSFMLPSLFFLLAVKKKGDRISTMERGALYLMFGFSILLVVMGTTASVKAIIADEATYG